MLLVCSQLSVNIADFRFPKQIISVQIAAKNLKNHLNQQVSQNKYGYTQ